MMGGEFTLTEREAEYLFRIIDSSINIFRRHQFFLWAQGELQGLLPHGMLICLFDEGNGQAVNIERFSRTDMDEIRFSELCRPDGGIVFRAMSAWSAGKNQPLLVCPNNSHTPTYKRFSQDLRRENLQRIAAHGMFDTNGRTTCFFTFTQISAALSERHAYFLELLMPHMHMALVRMLFHERHHKQGVVVRERSRKLITDRETEILRHVQAGKSNHEIAQLLHISPLTVKNHIQKILRKLAVNNRAHAVAKAMALKITL